MSTSSSAVSDGDDIEASQYNNLRTDVLSGHDHQGTHGAQLNASSVFSAGTVPHERGGVETDISAIVAGGLIRGTGTGTLGILAKGSASEFLRTNSGATDLEWAAPPVSDLKTAAANRLVTIGGTTTELEGEANLTFSTDLSITSGNIVIATSGNGIDFSAATPDESGGGSVTSEVLDDYEEGTWTPHFADSSLNAGMEGSQAEDIAVGIYTKIGRQVFYHCRIRISNQGDLDTSQGVRLLGFPFTTDNTSNSEAAGYCGTGTSMAITAGTYVAFNMVAGQTRAELYKWSATTGISELTVGELSVAAEMTFGGHYRV